MLVMVHIFDYVAVSGFLVGAICWLVISSCPSLVEFLTPSDPSVRIPVLVTDVERHQKVPHISIIVGYCAINSLEQRYPKKNLAA